MAAGESVSKKHSPIVEAIAAAEKNTTGEIRVHLSRRLVEKDAYHRAGRLFREFGMARTAQRNGVLLYVNLRRKKFAIVGDEGIHQVVGQHYWEKIAHELGTNLRTTHHERAIAAAVSAIGETLKKFFPAGLDSRNPNELPDEVSED